MIMTEIPISSTIECLFLLNTYTHSSTKENRDNHVSRNNTNNPNPNTWHCKLIVRVLEDPIDIPC